MTFEEYVLVRGAALLRFARLLSGDEQHGEDLVQEVLAKAFVRWRQIESLDRPEMYVRRMLINACHSWRRHSVNREVSVREVRSDVISPDAAAEIAERDVVWRLVLGLPTHQRAVIVLRYYEDYDDATIAELLQCSQGTVRTQVKRALAKLHRGHPQLSVKTGEQ